MSSFGYGVVAPLICLFSFLTEFLQQWNKGYGAGWELAKDELATQDQQDG
uniref:Uncharacterized protein n=1 Tax=Brassica oleracea var. oleracea TaxID=109376 RepID=A0A0D3D9N4_BRAOL